MNNSTATQRRPEWLDSQTLDAVRPAVRSFLQSAHAFGELPADERARLAAAMVKVSAYLANPEGVVTEATAPPGEPLAEAQADKQVDALKQRLAGKQGFAGQDFEAGAIRQGTEQFRQLVQAVDFPAFVGGLIQNVFQAIVTSSIEQMRAYGELLANVAKSVDDFARDNITENNARDWLSERFPGRLGVNTEGMGGSFAEGSETPAAQPRLATTGENPDEDLAQISREIEIQPPITDLSDENEELRLVTAARLQIARGRQQLLASMVVLGINRIVVTDGLIHAKVLFDLRASDQAKRVAAASMHDREAQRSKVGVSASYGGWFSPVKASASAETQTEHVATVSSAVDETSESKAEVKAKLSGEVRVNFKSDYFPMEKMASPQMIAAIQGNAAPPERRIEGT